MEPLERLKVKFECQVLEDNRTNLNQCFLNCSKNHEDYIPAHFCDQHIPLEYRDEHMHSLIKSVADITVRVRCVYVSTSRPEFWPQVIGSEEQCPYPFYKVRGEKLSRFGSGRINRVVYCPDSPCTCSICRQSDTPNLGSYIVFIDTATHVVFDEEEAKKASIRLFFDSYLSPKVNLHVLSMCYANVERDWCLLKCTTCDSDLGDALAAKLKLFEKTRNDFYYIYAKSRQNDPRAIIVSHPHGGPKQISLGHWENKQQVGDNNSYHRFHYTANTCPGSSGAPVYLMGFKEWGWWDELLHSGASSNGLNFSGAGVIYV
ncbi:uncharacterized protein LOC106065935 [Biomphalaria glabrata]|uniref:Uncharacterized protein LOC106065935 n=1 Tax=Biomphalaria glabrata TaxID=6526 RepID=A0A9W3BG24_BIOGL|nr:uncharacterized protein LOC106065935 [Biomphalaria glabrata]